LFGMLLFAVSSSLCTIANSGAMIISFRIAQGISCGMMISTSVAIITSVFPAEERGRAIGLNVAAVYLGLSVGPFLGGVLTQNLGWRSIFFISACLSVLVILLIFWKFKGEVTEPSAEKFDLIGSIAYSLSLLMILYSFTILPSMTGIILIVLGVLALLGFLWWEGKQVSPLLNLGLLRKNTVFIFSNLATLINYGATTAIVFLLSFYLQYIKGFNPQEAGFILLVQPLVMTMFSPFAGRLSDRVKPQFLASIGMAFNCAALLLFVFLNVTTSLGLIIGSLAIFGVGMGFFVAPNTNAVVSSVEKRLLGIASGTQATSRYIGMALSQGIVITLFSIYIGDTQITPENYSAFLASTKTGFIIFSILCFGGVFAQLAGGKVRRNK
jgi:MFS family permease